MLSIKKAPAQAVSGETNAGAPEGMSNSIRSSAFWKVPARVISYQKATCQGPIVVYGGLFALTHGEGWGMVKFPKFSVRRSNRLSYPPRTGKSIAAYSACHAAGVFIGRLAHIGRNISDFQYPRGLAASQRAGESSLFFRPLCV